MMHSTLTNNFPFASDAPFFTLLYTSEYFKQMSVQKNNFEFL